MSDIEFSSDEDVHTAQAIQHVVTSGLPLATGLRAYAEESSGQVQRGLLTLATAVEAGTPIREALHQPGVSFPLYLEGLITGGIHSHKIGPMLEEYLHQMRLQKRFGQKVAIDIAYPLIVLYFSALLSYFITVSLVPMFKAIYEDFGTELPGLTQLLIRLSDVLSLLSVPIVLGFIVAGLVLAVFLLGGRWSKAIVDRIPFLGGSARLASMSEFCSLLAPLVETSVTMPVALKAVSSTMQPSSLKAKSTRLAAEFDGAEPLSQAAKHCRFPHEIVHLLKWDQRGAAFGEILRSWAELFARMAAGRSTVISAILAPCMMVGIGLLVGMIVLALFLPLIRLLAQLS